jgi:hypothetical protein
VDVDLIFRFQEFLNGPIDIAAAMSVSPRRVWPGTKFPSSASWSGEFGSVQIGQKGKTIDRRQFATRCLAVAAGAVLHYHYSYAAGQPRVCALTKAANRVGKFVSSCNVPLRL